MATLTFDTLKTANLLKAAGLPEKQAEAHVAVLADALQVNFKDLVTKDDLDQRLNLLEQKLAAKFDALAAKFDGLSAKFDTGSAQTDTKFAKVYGEMALIKWMLGINLTLTTGVLIRLFFFRL